MAFLKAGDTISGQEGTAYITIDGRNEPMFEVKTIEATVELQKTEVKTLGKRQTQHKVNGAIGSGSMTIHKVTSRYADIVVNYLKRGTLPEITLKVTNSDPSSSIGRQTTLLNNVIIDSAVIAKLDVDAETLDEDVDFTFDDAEILERFKAPTLG